MKRKPIGVWFSVALVIFGLCGWFGFFVGSRYAGYRHRQKLTEAEKSYSPERARLKFDHAQYKQMEFLNLLVRTTQSNPKAQKEYLKAEIAMLEKWARQPDMQRIKPVMELGLGVAYAEEAVADERDGNKDQARRDMTTAQTIFKSLGWKDYSEEALTTVARNEMNSFEEKNAKGKAVK